MVKIDPALIDEEVQKQDQEVYGDDEQALEEDTAEVLEDMTGDDEEETHELNIAKEVEDDEKALAGIPDDVEEEEPDHIDDEVDVDPFGGVVGHKDSDDADEEDDDLFEE